jgi:hypothetical protein
MTDEKSAFDKRLEYEKQKREEAKKKRREAYKDRKEAIDSLGMKEYHRDGNSWIE